MAIYRGERLKRPEAGKYWYGCIAYLYQKHAVSGMKFSSILLAV